MNDVVDDYLLDNSMYKVMNNCATKQVYCNCIADRAADDLK